MPQHVFIPLLCIRYNILDRVSMIKAFAYCFPGVLLPLFQAEQHLCTFFKTSLTIFPCCGIVIKSTTWARSSAGRAFGSHPRGRGFDPLRVHQFAASFCTMRRFLCLKNFGRPCRAPNPEVGCEPGGVIHGGKQFARTSVQLKQCFVLSAHLHCSLGLGICIAHWL